MEEKNKCKKILCLIILTLLITGLTYIICTQQSYSKLLLENREIRISLTIKENDLSLTKKQLYSLSLLLDESKINLKNALDHIEILEKKQAKCVNITSVNDETYEELKNCSLDTIPILREEIDNLRTKITELQEGKNEFMEKYSMCSVTIAKNNEACQINLNAVKSDLSHCTLTRLPIAEKQINDLQKKFDVLQEKDKTNLKNYQLCDESLKLLNQTYRLNSLSFTNEVNNLKSDLSNCTSLRLPAAERQMMDLQKKVEILQKKEDELRLLRLPAAERQITDLQKKVETLQKKEDELILKYNTCSDSASKSIETFRLNLQNCSTELKSVKSELFNCTNRVNLVETDLLARPTERQVSDLRNSSDVCKSEREKLIKEKEQEEACNIKLKEEKETLEELKHAVYSSSYPFRWMGFEKFVRGCERQKHPLNDCEAVVNLAHLYYSFHKYNRAFDKFGKQIKEIGPEMCPILSSGLSSRTINQEDNENLLL